MTEAIMIFIGVILAIGLIHQITKELSRKDEGIDD